MTSGPAPFVIAIDVEPAPRHEVTGHPSEWDGFERCVEYLDPWRRIVFERTGAPLRITWFLRCDRQIAAYGHEGWALDRFSVLLSDLQNRGDELGLHVHPYSRTGDASWRQDWNDERDICDAVTAAASEYRCRLGLPRYFRSGDGWHSNALMERVEALGIEYDLTIEPGRTRRRTLEPDLGFTPDFTRAPRQPYRPSRDDFLVPDATGGRHLWVLPLTTGCFDHPETLHAPSEGHRVEMLHIAFESRFVQPFIDAALTSGAFSVAVTRTGDVAWSPFMFANFDYLLSHPQLRRVVIEPPASAMHRLLGSASGGLET